MAAIGSLVAAVAVGVVVFGMFIGAVLLFLGTVFVVSMMLLAIWWAIREYRRYQKTVGK